MQPPWELIALLAPRVPIPTPGRERRRAHQQTCVRPPLWQALLPGSYQEGPPEPTEVSLSILSSRPLVAELAQVGAANPDCPMSMGFQHRELPQNVFLCRTPRPSRLQDRGHLGSTSRWQRKHGDGAGVDSRRPAQRTLGAPELPFSWGDTSTR